MRTFVSFGLLGLVLPAAQALKITPGSHCAPVCGNVLDTTSPDDIVCQQGEYSTTDVGKMYENCLSCLATSVYTNNGHETDLQWMLYNLRYAISYCVFGVPKHQVASTPCKTSEGCGHYEDALTYKNLSSDVSAYEYCNAWPGDQTFKVQRCQECLNVDGSPFMGNYMIALSAGCDQKPAPGLMVGLDGDIFGTKMVNATAASPTASVDPSWFDDGPLTLPVKVGIAVAGFVVLLMFLGACIIWNGRRRRRAFLRKIETRNSKLTGWPSPQRRQLNTNSYPFPQQQQMTTSETRDTPMSQRPLRGGWDDSPMTAATEEKAFPSRYFSPYSSQYNSPVSAQETPGPQWQAPIAQWQGPGTTPQNIGLALGGDDSSGRWSDHSPERQHSPDTYEMHPVESAGGSRQAVPQQHYPPQPPVLAHPGYGRTSESPPRRYDLGEEDARGGRAF